MIQKLSRKATARLIRNGVISSVLGSLGYSMLVTSLFIWGASTRVVYTAFLLMAASVVVLIYGVSNAEKMDTTDEPEADHSLVPNQRSLRPY